MQNLYEIKQKRDIVQFVCMYRLKEIMMINILGCSYM